ncbi:MAG: hypothetical protein IPP38_02865 [Bacteroidetes bacterium]|nr:hypothetical protein [Bacteroidota bacterium]
MRKEFILSPVIKNNFEHSLFFGGKSELRAHEIFVLQVTNLLFVIDFAGFRIGLYMALSKTNQSD